jgi:hypothetical protein
MTRVIQFAFIAVTVCLSWLLMQAVHESGHVLHAWFSGGKVLQVVLTPLQISRTDYSCNPYPQFVVWGGPLWGCVVPVALALAAKWRGISCAPLLRFFAGFCLIANGVYLGSAPVCAVGDAQELLNYGVPAWALALTGLPAVAVGLYAWNGLGPYFGMGEANGSIDRRAAIGVAAALAIAVAAELLVAR